MNRATLLAAAAAAALLVPAAAPAVVPPKSCGSLTYKGKGYRIKADQISCKSGREHALRYLKTHRAPGGYKCKDLSKSRGRVNFYCNDGRKVFFGIRR